MKKLHAKIHPPLLQAPCSRFPHLCAPVGHERNRTVSPLLQAPYGRISAPFCPCANTDATALYRPCCKPRAAVFRALFAPVRIRTQLHCIAFAASTVQPYFRTSAPLCGHGRNRTVSPLPQAPCSRFSRASAPLCGHERGRTVSPLLQAPCSRFPASAPLCGHECNRTVLPFAASPLQPFSAPLRPCAGTNATVVIHPLCRKPLTAVFPHFLRRTRNFSAPPLCRYKTACYICNILTLLQ